MPRISIGPRVQKRTKYLLTCLLTYVEITVDSRGEKIQARWQDDRPELVVKTELRFLQSLTAHGGQELTKVQLVESLRRLEDYLGVLEDHRIRKQGSAQWHFTLKLWSKRTSENLLEFDRLWSEGRSQKSQEMLAVMAELAPHSPTQPGQSEQLESPNAGSKPTVQNLKLRLPIEVLQEIDQTVARRRPRPSRHQWILEAIHEKLTRDGQSQDFRESNDIEVISY
jgi:hypothetical protein